tara:strand:- start:14 stop:190 length:177 start_codon:yes stop_codon:yes gene_type:complete
MKELELHDLSIAITPELVRENILNTLELFFPLFSAEPGGTLDRQTNAIVQGLVDADLI